MFKLTIYYYLNTLKVIKLETIQSNILAEFPRDIQYNNRLKTDITFMIYEHKIEITTK